ncbi:MAG: hypothetical protein K5776_01635, partial [Lachnospiraceae bacterium]|nr:hypothetical protein [Lachnospiraceae bacterium]
SAVSVLILIVVWNLAAPFLIDNDNIYLKTVASGEMTGTPEPHMYYMGIISGIVISLFYRITGNGIPWFGIFMCASFASVMIILLYKSLTATKKIWQSIMVYAVFMTVYAGIFYQYFAKTQYTLATGFAGASALFLLFLLNEEEETKKYILKALPFLLLSAWSLGIRDKAFFMLIPFFGMVYVGKLLDAIKEKERIKRLFVSGGLFAAVLVFCVGINRLAYSSEDWKEFKRYTDASEGLFDYEGFPDYDTHKEIYDSMGITKSSYDAINRHYNILMDPEVNGDNFTRLAEISRNERLENEPSAPVRLLGVLKTIFRYNILEYQDRPINILVFLLYFFVVVMSFVSKKYKAFRDVSFVIVARMFDWIYLVWNGRFPFRVTQIIYIAEFVLLLAVIIKYALWEFENKKKKENQFNPAFAVLIIAILAATIRFGFPVMKTNYESIKAFRTMSVCFSELEDYLYAHKDNFYYFDMSHLYYMEDTLAFEKSEYENYVYMGSWMPNSPWYNNKLKSAGITDGVAEGLIENDNVFIIYQQVDFDSRDFLDFYFEEHFPGTKINVVDTFVSSNGFVYEILKPVYE